MKRTKWKRREVSKAEEFIARMRREHVSNIPELPKAEDDRDPKLIREALERHGRG